MKAVVCEAWGRRTLKVKELQDLQPGPGQVVIDVQAAGVNFPDVLIVQGKYQFKPELPFVPGSEVAGVIRSVADDVTTFKAGDKVIAFVPTGGFGQQLLAPAQALIPMPPGMDFETAAAITLTYGTSYHAIVDRAMLKNSENMLILGAAGGVGLAAIEIGKALGARIIACASSDREAGSVPPARRRRPDQLQQGRFARAVKAATGGKGPDVIYDPVGGEYTEPAFRSIAWGGRHLVVGFANGEIPKLPLNLTLLKGASLMGVFWGEFTKRDPKGNMANMRQLLQWLHEGKIKPHISGRYKLEQARKR
jgi:NADPH2:quinone reductase